MGTVYEVKHTRLDTSYVIKVIHPRVMKGKRRERIEEEAKILAKLKHENIVQVHWAGWTTDSPSLFYIAMEKLSGGTLRELLRGNARLGQSISLDWVLDIATQLFRALAHAHDRRVVHRDVKPENVFLDDQPGGCIAKLLDFGIGAVVSDPNRSTGRGFSGTYGYAAPEQLLGQEPTQACDVYAGGLVIYEMIAGRGPFAGLQTDVQVAEAHLREAPPPVSQWRDIPVALNELVHNMLQKDAALRPASATVISTLEEFRADLSLETVAADSTAQLDALRSGRAAPSEESERNPSDSASDSDHDDLEPVASAAPIDSRLPTKQAAIGWVDSRKPTAPAGVGSVPAARAESGFPLSVGSDDDSETSLANVKLTVPSEQSSPPPTSIFSGTQSTRRRGDPTPAIGSFVLPRGTSRVPEPQRTPQELAHDSQGAELHAGDPRAPAGEERTPTESVTPPEFAPRAKAIERTPREAATSKAAPRSEPKSVYAPPHLPSVSEDRAHLPLPRPNSGLMTSRSSVEPPGRASKSTAQAYELGTRESTLSPRSASWTLRAAVLAGVAAAAIAAVVMKRSGAIAPSAAAGPPDTLRSPASLGLPRSGPGTQVDDRLSEAGPNATVTAASPISASPSSTPTASSEPVPVVGIGSAGGQNPVRRSNTDPTRGFKLKGEPIFHEVPAHPSNARPQEDPPIKLPVSGL